MSSFLIFILIFVRLHRVFEAVATIFQERIVTYTRSLTLLAETLFAATALAYVGFWWNGYCQHIPAILMALFLLMHLSSNIKTVRTGVDVDLRSMLAAFPESVANEAKGVAISVCIVEEIYFFALCWAGGLLA